VVLIAAILLGQPVAEVCLHIQHKVSVLDADLEPSSDLEEYADSELEKEKTITELFLFESKNAAFDQLHLIHFIPHLWSDCSEEILMLPPEFIS